MTGPQTSTSPDRGTEPKPQTDERSENEAHKDELEKAQEDAAQEREEEGGYQ